MFLCIRLLLTLIHSQVPSIHGPTVCASVSPYAFQPLVQTPKRKKSCKNAKFAQTLPQTCEQVVIRAVFAQNTSIQILDRFYSYSLHKKRSVPYTHELCKHDVCANCPSVYGGGGFIIIFRVPLYVQKISRVKWRKKIKHK